MKGNMKKLVVFVVIATIATFISAAMASAFDHGWKRFHGEYAATSVGSCLCTIPNAPAAPFFTNSLTQQSIYTFNRDGTGTVQGTHFNISFSPNQTASVLDLSWQFTYEVTHDGTITMVGAGEWKVPVTGVIVYTSGEFSESGKLSEDHKTIILGSGPDPTVLTFLVPPPPVLHAICNISRVLIRVGE
jgi:hypothetical protein